MNSCSTFGMFVFLLFAYCSTPVQGNEFRIIDAMIENGETYTSTTATVNLINPNPTTYQIKVNKYTSDGPASIEATFGIEGIDTMIGKDLVLRTNDNNRYLQAEFARDRDVQQLFTQTTRSKLGENLYSYKLSGICAYHQDDESTDLSISGFEYSTTRSAQIRFIIHSGNARARELQPRILWTENDFNYVTRDESSIILTLNVKPAYKIFLQYFLVKFANASDLARWKARYGEYKSTRLPAASKMIQDYFRD